MDTRPRTEHFYSQVLDHFGAGERRFDQRYFVCRAGGVEWEAGRPVFFYTGNEANVELYVNATGLMWEWAPEFGALLVFAEHRYFGESVPAPDAAAPLAHLSTDQALGDFVELALALRRDILRAEASPIIGFGGSYGGMLCAWMRISAPWALDACISASAPIMSFEGLRPPVRPNFFAQGVTADASAEGGSPQACRSRIHAAWRSILGSSAPSLRNAFRLCVEPGSPWEVVDWVVSALDYMAMGSYPYPSSYILNGKGLLPPYPLRQACAVISAAAADVPSQMAALRDAAAVFYNYSGALGCFNTSGGSNNESARDAALWGHLYCSELLQVFGRDGATDMYWSSPWNATVAQQGCLASSGLWPDPGWVASRFGGWRAAESASRILFSNGGLDPWRGGGVQRSLGPELPAVLIPEVGHHIDLFWSHPGEHQAVRDARAEEKGWVRRWVEDASRARALVV